MFAANIICQLSYFSKFILQLQVNTSFEEIWSISHSFYAVKMIRNSTTGAYSRKQGHVCGITKKGQESPLKVHISESLPHIFSKFRVFWILPTPKRHVVLKVLAEDKVFYFWKMAFRPGTAHDRWLK